MLKKKSIRKLYAFLMAFCMLITTVMGDTGLTVYAADGTQTNADETATEPTFVDGNYVIYNKANSIALSSNYTGYNNEGVSLTKTDNGFDKVNDTEVWKISNTTDGAITIATYKENKKLSMGSYSSTPLNDVNDKWKLILQSDGTYYIENVSRAGYTLEWYAEKKYFSAYNQINDNAVDLFKMELVPVEESQIVSTGSSEPGDEPTEPTVADGNYVIYNKANSIALSSVYDGNYNTGVELTKTNDSFSKVNDTEVWKISSNTDGTVTIAAYKGNGKLSMGASFSSTPLNDVNDKWKLILQSDGTYYIENVNRAGYTLEWYAGKKYFSAYNQINDNAVDLFKMELVPVEESQIVSTGSSEPGDEPTEPTVADGNYVIYNKANSIALSSVYDGNYNTGVELTKTNDSFSKVNDTEVWKISSNTDGTVTIADYKGNGKLSMGAKFASTPLNDVNDKWKLILQSDGTYYIENVNRAGYTLEWYAEKKYFSAYNQINDNAVDLFKMELIPVTSDQIVSTGSSEPSDEPERVKSIDDGTYVIYSLDGLGVMKYGLVGGAAGSISATPTDDNKPDFGKNKDGSGTAVYDIEWQEDDKAYLIKCGSHYLSVDKSEALYLAEEPEKTSTNGSYWIIKYDDELKGYTIANLTAKYNTKDIYLEYYNSSFSGYTLPKDGIPTLIYIFDFLDASDLEADDGCVGKKPEMGTLPEVGKTYVIYNAEGQGVAGSQIPVVDGGKATLGAVNTTNEDGKLSVGNGGVIFTVKQDTDGHYLFESKGKYLATNSSEALALMTLEELEIARSGGNEEKGIEADDTWDETWLLEPTMGGLLIKSVSAAWTSSSGNRFPIYVEYFSGGFAGYSFKASSAEIFTFEFVEQTDEHDVGYVVNPKVIFNTKSDANLGVDYSVSITLDDLGENPSAKATAVFEDNSSKNYTVTLAEYNGTFTVPKEDLEGHKSMALTVAATSTVAGTTKISNYEATSNVTINDEPLITSVSPAANASTGDNKRPKITIYYANIGENATAILTIDGTAVELVNDSVSSSYSYTSTTDMIDAKYTLVATITREDGKKATKTWSFTVGESNVQVKFGQIHSHTKEYSDGSGTLEDAYEYAMEKAANTDYMIVTDHSNYFDTTGSSEKDSIYDDAAASILPGTGEYPEADASKTLNLWQEAKATADYYDKKRSDFVAGYGYEMTWSGGPGHINVFNSKGIVSRNNTELNNKTNNSGMLAFYNLLVDAQAKNATDLGGNIIAQFNHPGTTFGFFDSFTGLTEERDNIMNLIEVGNGDGIIGGTAYFPSYEYYDMCLSLGWHVAPTNGQDNHKGLWGDSNTARTVALTEGFTESSIYDAMTQRHIYSTEDQNLTMIFSLDEVLQGGIIENYDKDTVKLSITLADADKEALGTVYVIGENGKVLNEQDAPVLTDNTADLEIELDNTSAYYYIKVIQADGDIAVSAPIWVADVNANKAKVSAVITNASEADGKNPVAGTKEGLKSVLTNNEDSEVTVLSYSITADETVIDSKGDVNASVAAGENYEVSCEWQPKTYGSHEIKVIYVISVNNESQNIMSSKSIYVEGKDYNTVYKISDAKKGKELEEFTVEGIVTANASGFDKHTAFFDCIYIQDETSGINVFPVAGEFQVGQKVRVHGAITYYNGEIELNISPNYGGYIEIIDEEINPAAPKQVTAKEAMLDENVGLLMQISGTVSRIHEVSGVIDRIYIKDDSGEACVYINGYIWNSVTKDDTFGTDGITIAEGDKVTAIGIGSIDVDELGEVEYLHRLRTRDRAEINKDKEEEPEPDDPNQDPVVPSNPSTPSNPSSSSSSSSSSNSQTNTPQEPENNNTPNTNTEVKPDGTKVETTVETKDDGSVKETVTETKTDGSVKETVTETKSDGSSTETVKETNADGSTAESVKETKTDGSSVETKKVTSADNSAVLQAVIETDKDGNASASAVITTGVSNDGTIAISKDLLENAAEANVDTLTVEIAGQTVTSTTPSKVNTVINVSIPSVDKTGVDKIVLLKDGIAAAKATGKGLRVNVDNESGDSYKVTIRPKQLAKIGTAIESLDISLYADSAANAASVKKAVTDTVAASGGNQNATCVVSLAENASAANVGLKTVIPVANKADIAAGSTVYVYKYNKNTGKLEEAGNSRQTVSADGTVLIKAFSGVDYVISSQKLSGSNVVTIADSIKVAVLKTSVKKGNNTKVTISLPDTVTTGSKFGAEKAVITYKSNKTNIASVTAAGVIKAKKKGTVTITTTIKLASGQKITKKKKITIK